MVLGYYTTLTLLILGAQLLVYRIATNKKILKSNTLEEHWHVLVLVDILLLIPREEGDIGLFNSLVVSLTTLGLLGILIGWFSRLSVQTFQPKIVIDRKV